MASTVYGDGPFKVKFVYVWRWPWPFGRNCPPCPLIVAVPAAVGDYPVVVLQHGFMLRNDFYTELMEHVASHGYIVVAPRMYSCFTCPSVPAEIGRAVAVINWLPDNLAASFPEELSVARPDLQRLVLSGHSRGAKVAFGVALGKACSKLMTLKLSALAAFDPVDGTDDKNQTRPPIVNSTSHSFQLGFPTLIVGTELGSQKAGRLCPACAPENFNHKDFYRCSSPPTYHFVAAEYGHMDFLNDDTRKTATGLVSYRMCKNGSSRAPLRNFAGGILVAFLKATLFGDRCALNDALEHSPILLSTVESCTEECSVAVSDFSSV